MTRANIIFEIGTLSLIVLLFGGLYARDIMRMRERTGKRFVAPWFGALLSSFAFFAVGVLMLILSAIMDKFFNVGHQYWYYYNSYNSKTGYLLVSLLMNSPILTPLCFACSIAALLRWPALFPGPKSDAQIAFIDELALCMERRLPVDGLLDAVATDTRSPITGYARTAAARLREGAPLSVALGLRTILPPHAIASIRAGKKSGGATLPRILRRIFTTFRADREAHGSMKIALIYITFIALAVLPVLSYEWLLIALKFSEIAKIFSRQPPRIHPVQMGWWLTLDSVMNISMIVLLFVLLTLISTIKTCKSRFWAR